MTATVVSTMPPNQNRLNKSKWTMNEIDTKRLSIQRIEVDSNKRGPSTAHPDRCGDKISIL